MRLAQTAERSGFEYALTQIRFTAGYGAENQHESVSFSHALLAKTEKLKVIAAILPGPWKPVLAAKQLATIDYLTQGRIAINVVSGWFRGEFDAIGEVWPEHDERYVRSEEFIHTLKGIWTTDNYSFDGKYYQFQNYTLKPKPLQKPSIEVFQGGSSRAARDMAARVSDWYFTNGNTPEGIKAQVDDIRAKAAANHHSVKVGVNAFVIARDTEEEARAVLAEIAAAMRDAGVKNLTCVSNNAAERSLRPAALGRKAWLFAGSQAGGERAALIYTLIGTAKLNNIDPQAWLAHLLAHMPSWPASRLHELAPWNWKPAP